MVLRHCETKRVDLLPVPEEAPVIITAPVIIISYVTLTSIILVQQNLQGLAQYLDAILLREMSVE